MNYMPTFGLSNQIMQIIRFALIGVLNTVIDLTILNILILLFGIGRHAELYLFFKGISFTIAVINSYICNKYWVFRSVQANSVSTITSFVAVSIVGLLFNIATAFVALELLVKVYPGHTQLLATIAALCGTCAVLVWNFFGYKFFVFKN